MQVAPLPTDEQARLASLQALGLLETGPDERFDRITRLASRMFNVPVAVMSLVDQDRQWFKSSTGMSGTSLPRDQSLCAHAILREEPLVVPDLLKDPRFADLPAVHGLPSLRFYAGAPLRWRPGSAVGTLCILDRWPRHLASVDVAMLQDLASLVVRELQSMEQASIDTLTGLPSRAGFVQSAEQALGLCHRLGASAVLCGFRLQRRHAAALASARDRADDESRRDFAQLLRSSLRGSDLVARIGLDSFAVLATHSTERDLLAVLDRLKLASPPRKEVGSGRTAIVYRTVPVPESQERGTRERVETLLARLDSLLDQSP